ncbi:MAG: DUF1553 domain-containing protein [Acidobacteriia bacterium]|nr:DUF1553 domain-containing protein [Terriglobia bacterium]
MLFSRSTLLRVAGMVLVPLTVFAGESTLQPDTAPDGNQLKKLTIETIHLNSENPDKGFVLHGRESRLQLLVTGLMDNGKLADYTRQVKYQSVPAGLIKIDENGYITPFLNGVVKIIVKGPNGLESKTKLDIRDTTKSRRINFTNQIVPIFTKLGCNSGGCHGKASGQNGFRLSLLGFEPKEDFEHLVIEGKGRRLSPAAPDQSLLLLKAAGIVPHGGGSRIDHDSPTFELLSRWIKQGMPFGKIGDPKVTKIIVSPTHRLMSQKQKQQLAVTAIYTDGSTKDVTRLVQYESNEKEMAEVSKTGLVELGKTAGQVAVMIRFQDQVTVFRATIPHGAPIEKKLIVKNFIDELVQKTLKTLELSSSPPCDDATFVRRASIDITGRLPTPTETKNFLENSDPKKREKWIHSLLESPGYSDYFANKWNAILRNKRRTNNSMRGNFLLHSWIRQSFQENKSYDLFAKEIITASGDIARTPAVTWFREVKNQEDQVQDVAQIFLGVRLQCAQCHHHPFEKWSQQDYYGFAAFFSQMGRKPGSQTGEEIIFHQPGIPAAINPKTKLPVRATGLGTGVIDIPPDQDPRVSLADWMAQKDNPFFARMLVNRYWKHFLGRGLVEPEDDMRITNPPTNPELLDALAKHFIDNGYDLKNLIYTICESQTYQRSSLPNKYNSKDSQTFSRYYAKRLTAEVLLDAIDQVTNVNTIFPGQPEGIRAVQLPDDSFNSDSYFLSLFGRPNNDSASESERTNDANLAQSLHLINSPMIYKKISNPKGRAVVLANDKSLTDEEKVRELYSWVYSRQPDNNELKVFLDYIDFKRRSSDKTTTLQDQVRIGYQDTLWALINSKEFLFNH